MPETLYIIDTYAQIFRAYYAIRGGMRSPVTSEPTHAVFGVAGMLFKLFNQFHPHYVVAARDTPGPTFRDILYAEYKATRSATPDDLISQIERVFELVDCFGIPIIGYPGLEADDVIATITRQVLENPAYSDVHIRLVSRDKDLEQLICDRVALFDIHTDTTIDAATLKETKGIEPHQVVDYLALLGDKVDNVPGVPGVGEKTAQQLIAQYGSIEGILANLDNLEVRGAAKIKAAFEAARETLPLSRQLVTLRSDADFHFSLEAARVRPLDLSRMLTLFQELGFNRYQDEARRLVASQRNSATDLPAPAPEPPQAPAQATLFDMEPSGQSARGDYRAVLTPEALQALLPEIQRAEILSVDTETTGLGRDALLCGIALAWKPKEAVYIPTLSPEPASHMDAGSVLEILRPILENPAVPKCGHNLKFDARVLLRYGIRLRGVVFDTMLAAALVDPTSQNQKLDHLARTLLGHEMIPLSSLIGEEQTSSSIDQAPLEQVTQYAAEDADIALRLRHHMAPTVEQLGMTRLLTEVESPLSAVLARMEHNGILCDKAELARQGELLKLRAEEIRRQILEAAGCDFSPDSPKQLAEVLFDRLGMQVVRKTKTGRSTDNEVLETLAALEDVNDPRTAVPRLVIEYRQLTKLISTYLGSLADAVDPATGRIHTTFHQLVTATGRLASQGPNLQNIPVRTEVGRQIRKAFIAPPDGLLICADYSQIELRVLAHLSEDENLVRAFQEGQDIHAAVAAQVWGGTPETVTREQRENAKTVNFGIIYGVTPYGLSRRIAGLDVSAAATLIEEYKARFPGIGRFLETCVAQALSLGYVTTFMGRRRAIPEIRESRANRRALGERLAINTVVQGSAADLMKLAMVRVQDRIDNEGLPMKMLLQIHDELVLEAPAAEAPTLAQVVRHEMEHALELKVPLVAEVGCGPDWLTAK